MRTLMLRTASTGEMVLIQFFEDKIIEINLGPSTRIPSNTLTIRYQ
jgi:hypothetical protein